MPQQQPLNPAQDAAHLSKPPWWLRSGHLQTWWPFIERPALAAPNYTRERWSSPDGDFVDVDFHFAAPNPKTAGSERPQRPLLILFHGLEGSSQSHYAQTLAHWAAVQGWDMAVPHFRGCSGELNRAPRAYHSGDFEEIAWIVRRLSEQFSTHSLYAVGVSLGGNALLRYLGEYGDSVATPLQAAAAVCAPLNLAASAQALESGLSRWIYTPYFLRTLKVRALAQLTLHPQLFEAKQVIRARTLREFDDAFTAPLHGYRNVDDYYTQASSLPHLNKIRACPVLIVNPLNDPFVPRTCLPTQNQVSSRVTLWQPRYGGHVGFTTGPQGLVQSAATWLLAQRQVALKDFPH